MSRDDGFAVMDVSTSWLDDDKVQRLAREYPGLVLWGVAAYEATKSASWRHGKRMKVGDSLPSWLALDADGIGALLQVRLLDRTLRIPVTTWKAWFGPAQRRRQNALDRWARSNAKRRKSRRSTHDVPRGSRAATMATVRPSVRPSDSPTEGERDLGISRGAPASEARASLRLVDSVEETA